MIVRVAPPGISVKYENDELKTIERLLADIGHFEVQVTPDNCAVTLIISVDQIVEDGRTVSFSKITMVVCVGHLVDRPL